ncbi:MAG: long-chain fatty acid--CoA ligase [Marinifilaceae bacterium]|jgi:long-chain acyl-CoA synthetase|nr:long-chain fatty acid--CoA ligase [Marinifilaceae bacterium]
MNNIHWGKIIQKRVKEFASSTCMSFKNLQSGVWENITWDAFGKAFTNVSKAMMKYNINIGDKISIFSQNMPSWLIADTAILNIGAVTVPIYPTSSSNEVSYILNDSQSKIVFVGEQEQYDKLIEVKNQIPSLELIVVFDKEVKIQDYDNSIYFDEFLMTGKNHCESIDLDERHSRIQSDDLATLIYTSGTTGEPKGVMHDHENIIRVIQAHDSDPDLKITREDDSLSFLPLSHVYERGWCLYCFYKGVKISFNQDPKKISSALREVKPTIMCAVPRLFEKIFAMVQDKKENAGKISQLIFDWSVSVGKRYNIDHVQQEKNASVFLKLKHKIADKLVLSKIRAGLGGRISFMPCGGAPISAELLSFFHSVGINIKVGYGLTETFATVTFYPHKRINFNSAGKEIIGTQVKIGENNEILVKGPGVMRGYYNKPKETAEVLNDGWFRTGDAGTIGEDGYLVVTDRIKDLMKTSGGKYIAPQKLETTLINDKYFEQVAVIGDCRKYVTALAVPAFEPLRNYAQKHNISFESIEELLLNSQIIEFFEKRLESLQKEFARFEQIKKITLLPAEFTIETGEVTSTLKLKRNVIHEKYKHLIELMYRD